MAQRSGETFKALRIVKTTLSYLFLAALGVSMIIPFLWMVSTAFKDKGEVFTYPPKWLPTSPCVKVGEDWHEVRVVETQYGEVEVRLLAGRRRGDTLRVSSDKIWRQVDGTYVKDPDTKDGRLRAQVLTETKPTKVKVKFLSDGPLKDKVEWYERRALKKRFAPVWENYTEVWQAIPFGRYYLNSIIVTVLTTVGRVVTSALAAYAFARLRFPLRDQLFVGYLATLMVPGWVTMIPVFILLRTMPDVLNFLFSRQEMWWSQDLYFLGEYFVGRSIGIDSYFALIVPGCFSAYGTFLLRQFFMGIETDLEDAAKIDGCSFFGIFSRVILPLSKPALATLTIFSFMGAWQSFIWPLIVTNSKELKVLYVGLAAFQGMYTTDWTLLMAASLMALLPVIIVFLLGQRYFVEGIRLGAVKG